MSHLPTDSLLQTPQARCLRLQDVVLATTQGFCDHTTIKAKRGDAKRTCVTMPFGRCMVDPDIFEAL